VVVVVVEVIVVIIIVVVAVVEVVIVLMLVVVMNDNRSPFTCLANFSVKFSLHSTVFIVWIKSCLAWV
jgi:hypothetical protein